MTVPTPSFQAPPVAEPAPPAPEPQRTAPPAPRSPATAPEMDPDGFPLETPWRAMDGADTPAARYLLKQSRKHEAEAKDFRQKFAEAEPEAKQLRALSDASKSDLERERDQAKAEAETLRQQAAEARETFGAQVVEARLSGAAEAKGMTPQALKTLAGDLTRFLGDQGVNGEAVDDWLSALPDKAAATPLTPRSLGGGNRGKAPAASGADLYALRHPKSAVAK